MQRAALTPPPPDEDTIDCPLCMEEIDPTDRHFKPCPCGYHVCRFCWNRIRQNENERCPACRRVYTDEAVEFTPLTAEELTALNSKSKKKSSKTDSAPSSTANINSSPLTTTRKEFMDEEDGPVLPSRRHLVEVRVTQKNLVYVIGIPIHLADEATLKHEDYFGRFGKILKLVINKRAYVRTTGNGAINNAAAYITFSRDDEASKAIKLVDGKMIEGAKLLRATYGTTKYCAHFLRGKQCPKSGCLYLHHEVFDNEISTGDVSNLTSPPASPSPMVHSSAATFSHQTPAPVNEMEYDRVKSFFDRLHKWTKMDDLLADLSPEADFMRSDTMETPSFNPFDDPIAVVSESLPQPRRLSIQEIFASTNQTASAPEPPKPPVAESQSKKTPPKVFTTAQLASKKQEKTTSAPIPEVKPVVAEDLFVSVPSAAVQNPKTTAPPATTTAPMTTISASKTPSKPSTPTMNTSKKSVPNANLFSVLSVEDMAQDNETVEDEEKEEKVQVVVDKQPTTSKSNSTSNKKPSKKDPKKQLEEDLDELWKQIEATKPSFVAPATTTSKTPQQQQPAAQKAKPVETKKASAKPTPPLANLFAALTSANERRDTNGVDFANLENESARRIFELEKALKECRMDSREIEERLRESVAALLQGMNITLDDDYFNPQ